MKCKGLDGAKGHGCGKEIESGKRKKGLGIYCCYTKWLLSTPEGKNEMDKARIKGGAIVKKEYIKKAAKEKKEGYEKLKTLGQYEADSKKSFQLFVRLRDEKLNCISCGCAGNDIWDGGHYFKAELFSGLIFDERNCHKQCRKCNRYLGGNEIAYRIGLCARFGEQFVKQLEADSVDKRVYKFSKQELIEIKKIYDDKVKELKK